MLSLEDTLAFMQPVLSSLAIVHNHYIIHRDISPDNIMISRTGEVKLIDFGAARSYDTDDGKSKTVMVKKNYAPYEQYFRNSEQKAYTDIYALCATMYKMLTGDTPPDAQSRHEGAKLIPINKYKKVKVPQYIEKVIRKGLAEKGSDRYQTITELYQDLYATDAERLEMKVDRVQKIVLGITMVLVIGALICVYVAIQNRAFTPEEETIASDSAGDKFSARDDTSEDADNREENSGAQRSGEETEQKAVREEESGSSLLDGVTNQDTERIRMVKNSVFDNYSQDHTVEEIFDRYFENGVWQEQLDTNGDVVVNYIGEKDGDLIAFRFYVYDDGTFSLTDIARNGSTIPDMNSYFESIIESVGL